MTEMIYNEGFDLAKLPYFDVVDDRLVLADKTIGPVIDAHTHIALAYLLPMSVDQYSTKEPTEHYLPMKGRPINFECYLNKNFSEEDLSRMKSDLVWKSTTSGGMRRTHTFGNLQREMKELGIKHSIVLPIDFPVLSHNAEFTLELAKKQPEIIGFGSVHPYAFNVEGKLDKQVAMGVKGIKVHPAVQLVRADNHRAMKLYKLCGERKLPVLFHCGPVGIELKKGRELSQVVYYEKPIAENPDVTFILGHSGALQMEQALDYTKRYPNVVLELSGQSLSNVRKIFEEADPNRVMYGTDWPFYHQALAMAKVLIATEGEQELRHKVLYKNAADLFGIK